VSVEYGQNRKGRKERKVRGRKEDRKEEHKKKWGKERKVEQERAKHIDTSAERKREIDNNKIFKNFKNKNNQ
jgi:hypothetical protein